MQNDHKKAPNDHKQMQNYYEAKSEMTTKAKSDDNEKQKQPQRDKNV